MRDSDPNLRARDIIGVLNKAIEEGDVATVSLTYRILFNRNTVAILSSHPPINGGEALAYAVGDAVGNLWALSDSSKAELGFPCIEQGMCTQSQVENSRKIFGQMPWFKDYEQLVSVVDASLQRACYQILLKRGWKMKRKSLALLLLSVCATVLAAITIRVSIPHTLPYDTRVSVLQSAITAWAAANAVSPYQSDPWVIIYSDNWSQQVSFSRAIDPACTFQCGLNANKIDLVQPYDYAWTYPAATSGSGAGAGGSASGGYNVTINGHWRYGYVNGELVAAEWIVDSIVVNTNFDPGKTIIGGRVQA